VLYNACRDVVGRICIVSDRLAPHPETVCGMRSGALRRPLRRIFPAFCGKGFSLPGRDFLPPGPLADLHVAHLRAVDRKAHGRADLVEAVFARCAGVDVQQVVDRIVHDLEYMGVPRDEEFGVHAADSGQRPRVVAAGVAADVGHQHPHAFAVEDVEVGVDAARERVVDVSGHGPQGLEGCDAVRDLERTDVARVPDFVHVAEELPQRVVERAVRVGDDPYAFHLYFSFHNCAIRSAIFASAAFPVLGS